MIECQICGREFDSLLGLSTHIRYSDTSNKNYYDKYLKKDGDGVCICGKSTSYLGLRYGYSKYCCHKCSANSDVVQFKRKVTLFDRYGVDNPSKYPEFQNKRDQTWISHYGVNHPSKSSDIKEKKRQTSLRNYGVDNPLKSKVVRDKFRIICLKKYGFKFSSQYPEIKDKCKNTCLKRYGVEYSIQSDIVKDKIKNSLIKRYGERPFHNPQIRNKYKKTCLMKYGVDNWAKTEKAKKLFRELFIKYIEEKYPDGMKFQPRIGNHEPSVFDILQKNTSYQILLQKNVIGYFPDGYISKLNLVIEYDEPSHNLYWAKIRDSKKDKSYQFYGYKVFRIKEKEWENSQQSIIDQFKEIIMECVKNV